MKYPNKPERPDEYNPHWIEGILILVCIGIIMCALWAMQSSAEEEFPDPYIIVGRAAVLDSCFNEALKVASTIEFDTQEDWMDSVSMMTGGCMYYQWLEYTTCEQTPFAYPIEPDGSPSEFDHQF